MHFVVYFVYDDRNTAKIWTWDENVHKKNHADEMRVNAHDYFHYFGNVIDLAKFSEQIGDELVINFLEHEISIIKDDNWYYLTKKDVKYTNSKDIDFCKEWVAKYFTNTFRKFLPMYNIKFIFS